MYKNLLEFVYLSMENGEHMRIVARYDSGATIEGIRPLYTFQGEAVHYCSPHYTIDNNAKKIILVKEPIEVPEPT